MLKAWLTASSNGDLTKAMREKSVSFDVALSCLGSALFQESGIGESVFLTDSLGSAAADASIRRAHTAVAVVNQLDCQSLKALIKVVIMMRVRIMIGLEAH